jgi:hypothetical protein
MIHLNLILLRKPTSKKTHTSSSKGANANLATLVSCLSPLTISHQEKKGLKPSAPAGASYPQALYTLYDGIPTNMTHAAYNKVSMGFNNVFALNHKNLHTFFFRVDGSRFIDKNLYLTSLFFPFK